MMLNHFKICVSTNPLGNAIIDNDYSVTYQELDRFSDIVCAELIERNVLLGEIVGVSIERSWEFVACVLGILKSGCIYMPLESDAPLARTEYMLQHANCRYVLFKDVLTAYVAGIEYISFAGIPHRTKRHDYKFHENAYIMYTSGSTGQPKGVVIKQRGIVRLVINPNYITLNNATQILATSSTTFDSSTFEIFAAILNGGTLHITNKVTLFDTPLLKSYISTQAINVIWFTSPLFNQLIDRDESIFESRDLKYLIIGGDVLSPPHINKVLHSNSHIKVINGYGPTENTTFSTTYEINDLITDVDVPIGKPISGTQTYILKDDLTLADVGEKGELYVGGEGIMKGYLNDEVLTHEALVANPFDVNDKLYKTGDICCWDENKNIRFIERKDSQVKISGRRVELNEIKYAIKRFEGVTDSLVHYDKTEDVLTAYVISLGVLNAETLKGYLTERLPKYMIPTTFVQLDRFPLNNNGKINLSAINSLKAKREVGEKAITLEQKVLEIYLAVLGLDRALVNLESTYFELGGTSIKTFKLLHEIEKATDVKIPLADFFREPSIKFLLSAVKTKSLTAFKNLDIVYKKKLYKASSAQKRLFFLQQMNKVNVSYNITSAFEIIGQMNLVEITGVLKSIVARHEILRTKFILANDDLHQVISETANVELKIISTNSQTLQNTISQFVQPFDLTNETFKVGLIRLTDDRNILIFDFHHIVYDGLSAKILMKDICALLNGHTLDYNKFTFKDFAEWQHTVNYKKAIFQQRKFWLDVYRDFDNQPFSIFPDCRRPEVFSGRGDSIDFEFDQELTSKLRIMATSLGVTMFNLIYALFNVLLAKLSDLDDIIIGVPVSGRTHADLENIIGLFVNTLPFKVGLERDISFSAFLFKVKEFSLQALDNQEYPLEDLIKELTIERDISRNPLFDVLFSYVDFGQQESSTMTSNGLTINPFPFSRDSTSFDITLIVSLNATQLKFTLEYYSEIFDKETIRQFPSVFKTITKTVVEDCSVLIKDIELCTPEPGKIATKHACMTFDSHQSIISLFLEQVSKTPQKQAVIFHEESITYNELNEKALALGHHLTSIGFREYSVIAISLDRSPNIIVAMLGIMYSNCSYLPLDPSWPVERISSVLEQASASLLITSFNCPISRCSPIPTIFIEHIATLKSINTSINLPSPDAVAYIIYTSGSTGEPKGVKISHKAITNTLLWRRAYYNYNSLDVTLQIPSFFFDSSVEDIFTSLISGATLVMINSILLLDIKVLLEITYLHKVTNFLIVPSLYRELLPLIDSKRHSLRFITLAGESTGRGLLENHFKLLGNVPLYNEYGPTECSVCATVHHFLTEDEDNIIGLPIDNITVYILNRDLNVLPVGIAGELYLSGRGLSDGYHNDQKNTQRAFLKNPFDEGVIYKTGDIVRLTHSNKIEFIGRKDQQIKLRGLRIETGEIEYHICRYPGIEEARVVKRSDRESLRAFFMANYQVDVGLLRKFLSQCLPFYMLPEDMTQLVSFPRTNTGKIDLNILSKLKVGEVKIDSGEPLGELEKNLLDLWKIILKREDINRDDNFFATGGNSIDILNFKQRLEDELALSISIDKFFQFPNIRSLAKYFTNYEQDRSLPIEDVNNLLMAVNLFKEPDDL